MSEAPPRTSQRIPLLGAPMAPPQLPSAVTLDERVVGALGLGAAFELASAELGFVSASWLFIDEVARVSEREGVLALRDELGSSFAVLDFVATEWLEGKRSRTIQTASVARSLEGARRVLIVGLEARHLDALVAIIDPSVRLGLLTYRLQRVDWERVIDNYRGRIEPVDVAAFQGWAGSRSVVLTFVYGTRGHVMNVLPAFLRVIGPDVRTQFRDIIGWNVLGGVLEVHPRYLVETLSAELTELVDETDR